MDDTHALVVFLIVSGWCVLCDDGEKNEKGKMRCEGDGWKSESGNTKNNQKPMAQVKTSTAEMMNESA